MRFFLSKIQKMKSVDAEKSQKTPIEDTNHGEHKKQARKRKAGREAHPNHWINGRRPRPRTEPAPARNRRCWTRGGPRKRDRAPEEITHKPCPEKTGQLHHDRATRFAVCTFGIQLKNHEKRFWQASSGQSTQPRRRNHQTAAQRRSLEK